MARSSSRFGIIVPLLLTVALATSLMPLRVDAAPVTQPIGYSRLHFHFLLPSNMDGVTPYKIENNCMSYISPDSNALVQICRLKNRTINNYKGFWTDNKNDIANQYTEVAQENSSSQYGEVNGMKGQYGIFFYQTNREITFANLLYVAQAGNDIIQFLYQAPVDYSPGPDESFAVLKTLDVFSP